MMSLWKPSIHFLGWICFQRWNQFDFYILLSHDEVHNCNKAFFAWAKLYNITSCLSTIRTLVTPDLITNSPYGSQGHRRLFVGRIKHFTRRHKYIQIVNSVLKDGKMNRNIMLIFILSLVTNSVNKWKLVNSAFAWIF